MDKLHSCCFWEPMLIHVAIVAVRPLVEFKVEGHMYKRGLSAPKRASQRQDGGQNTHLICVHLKIRNQYVFWGEGSSGFPVFLPPFSYIYFWTFSVQSPQRTSKNIRKTAYDCRTGWAAIRCVTRRSLKV